MQHTCTLLHTQDSWKMKHTLINKISGNHWENPSIQNTTQAGSLYTLWHTPESTYFQNGSPGSPGDRPQWRGTLEGWRQQGRGRGRQKRGGCRRRSRGRTIISEHIRAALAEHVINHGLTLREAGQRVHPQLSRFTLSSIIGTFLLESKLYTHTLPGVFTPLFYQVTISHLLYPRVANAPHWTKVVVLWHVNGN